MTATSLSTVCIDALLQPHFILSASSWLEQNALFYNFSFNNFKNMAFILKRNKYPFFSNGGDISLILPII